MNCSTLDSFGQDASRAIAGEDIYFGIALAGISVLSLLLVAAGERFVRPLAAVLGGAAGGVSAFLLTRFFDPPLPCEARLGIAAVAAIVFALLAVCIVKMGLFLLGGFGLGAVAHLLWMSLPLDGVSGPFTLFGVAGWHYIAVGAAALSGAIVSQCQRKRFVRMATSLAGGTGLAAATFLVFERIDSFGDPPPLLLLGIVVAATPTGACLQARLEERRKKKRERVSV